jgi:hypothetical protein
MGRTGLSRLSARYTLVMSGAVAVQVELRCRPLTNPIDYKEV